MEDTFKRIWDGYGNLISFLVGIPLSLLVNLATPKVQTWWRRRSRSASQKEIVRLGNQIKVARRWSEHPHELTHELISAVYMMLGEAILVAFLLFFIPRNESWGKVLTGAFACLEFYFFVGGYNRIVEFRRMARDPDSFESATSRKIRTIAEIDVSPQP